MEQFFCARPAFRKDEKQVRQTTVQTSIEEFSFKKNEEKRRGFLFSESLI